MQSEPTTTPDFKVVRFGHFEYRRVCYLIRPFINREKTRSKQVAPPELQYPGCLVFYKQNAPPELENCVNQDLLDERIFSIGLEVFIIL
jgi:hypothetical protein